MRRKAESRKDYCERMRQLAFFRLKKYGCHWKGKHHTPESKLKISKYQKSLNRIGEKALGWIDGRYKRNLKDRYSLELNLWRSSVFERDDYTCQSCKIRGGKLQADHIKPFSLFPELRFSLENGRTLCIPCHKKTDTYGRKVFNYGKNP